MMLMRFGGVALLSKCVICWHPVDHPIFTHLAWSSVMKTTVPLDFMSKGVVKALQPSS